MMEPLIESSPAYSSIALHHCHHCTFSVDKPVSRLVRRAGHVLISCFDRQLAASDYTSAQQPAHLQRLTWSWVLVRLRGSFMSIPQRCNEADSSAGCGWTRRACFQCPGLSFVASRGRVSRMTMLLISREALDTARACLKATEGPKKAVSSSCTCRKAHQQPPWAPSNSPACRQCLSLHKGSVHCPLHFDNSVSHALYRCVPGPLEAGECMQHCRYCTAIRHDCGSALSNPVVMQ